MSTPDVERKQLKPLFRDRVAEAKAKEEALRTLPRQKCLEMGYITVQDLDDEELRSGRCRDLHTGLIPHSTNKTELIPKSLYDEMVAEHEARTNQRLRQSLDDMLDIMIDIAKDDTVEPKDRFEAAKYLFERTAGRAPATVNVNVHHAPWEELLNAVSGIGQITRDEHRQLGTGIIDAEVVEDDEQGQEGDNLPDEQVRSMDNASDLAPQNKPSPREGLRAGQTVREEPYGTSDTPRSPASTKEDAYTGQHSARPPSTRYPTQPDLVTKEDHQLSYAEQARNQEALAARRAAVRKRIQGAKKGRKIARAMGADAIQNEIVGIGMDEDGQVKFETE